MARFKVGDKVLVGSETYVQACIDETGFDDHTFAALIMSDCKLGKPFHVVHVNYDEAPKIAYYVSCPKWPTDHEVVLFYEGELVPYGISSKEDMEAMYE